MDKNTIFGLVLIMGIVITWSIFFSPDPSENIDPKPNTEIATPDSVVTETDEITDPRLDSLQRALGLMPSDSIKSALEQAQLFNQFGLLANAAKGENQKIRVKTDKLDGEIHTLGGTLKQLSLNEYVTYDTARLFIVKDDPDNEFSIEFSTKGDKVRLINTKDLYFTPQFTQTDFELKEGDSLRLSFQAQVDALNYLEFVYVFRYGKYDYDFKVHFVGIDKTLLKDRSYYLRWVNNIPKTEKSVKKMRENTGIYYREAGEVEEINPRSEDFETEKVGQTSVDWIAFKSNFFTQVLIADPKSTLQSIDFTMSTPTIDEVVKKMTSFSRVGLEAQNYRFYAGPKELSTLKSYGLGLENQISLGWGPLTWINEYFIIPVFHFLERAVGNYGLIILLIAIMIKLLVSPLTYKTYISSAKMRVINETPEVKELEVKYKDDATKLQQEKMAYYRTVGASPFGGCLPMLLQYPVLISMFYFFPQSIELRQQKFLWAEDLSTYDSIFDFPGGFSIPFYGDHVSLFTILMAASIFVFTWISQKTQGTSMTANNPVMKWMPYIMPIFLLGFLNNYSAGLSYYYFLSNILSIGQSVVTKALIDDKKLLDQMHSVKADRKKSGKKSRIETWMEKQQKKQKELQSTRGAQMKGQAGRREKRKNKD